MFFRKIKALLKKEHFVAHLMSIPVKRMFWYKDTYGDLIKFKNQKFNTRFVVLGSSPAKWAFDESVAGPSCANWATAPQSIADDFRVLKNYHSYISHNGFVFLFFSHCRGLKRDYSETSHFRKYHFFLHPILNPFYDEHVYTQLKNEIDFPICYVIRHPIKILKSFIKCDLLKRCTSDAVMNRMNEVQLEKDADKWISGWKKEFGEDVFEIPLRTCTQESVSFNKELILEIAEFCKERGLRLAFVIPPLTKTLKSKFSKEFTQTALYDLMAPAQKKYNIPLFDYLNDEELQDKDLYFNSFFLNRLGRKVFTRKLLENVGEIE